MFQSRPVAAEIDTISVGGAAGAQGYNTFSRTSQTGGIVSNAGTSTPTPTSTSNSGY